MRTVILLLEVSNEDLLSFLSANLRFVKSISLRFFCICCFSFTNLKKSVDFLFYLSSDTLFETVSKDLSVNSCKSPWSNPKFSYSLIAFFKNLNVYKLKDLIDLYGGTINLTSQTAPTYSVHLGTDVSLRQPHS